MFESNKNRFLFALLVGIFAIAGFWMLRRREPSLLDHARHIANTGNIPATPGSFYWLNDNEFLYLMPMQKAGAFQVMRRNIQTGEEAVQGNLPSGGFQLSPDGLWSLTYKSARVGSVFTVERTDGSRKLLYRSPGQGQPELAWMPDNSAVVELLPPFAEKGKTHPGLLRAYSLESAIPIASTSVDEDSVQLSIIGALSNNHVLVLNNAGYLTLKNIELLDFSLERDSVARHYTIPIPTDVIILEAALSPKGEQIAWIFGFEHDPWGINFLRRPYEMLHIYPSYSNAIWISKPDGSGLHEIGSIPFQDGFHNPSNPRLSNLRWTTDNKNLSFLYKNNLYIIPAR